MKFLLNLKIGTRLALVFGAIIVILLGYGVQTFRSMAFLEGILDNISDSRVPDLTDLAAISTERMILRVQTVSALNVPFSAAGKAQLREIRQDREDSWMVVTYALHSLDSRPRLTETGRTMLRNLNDSWNQVGNAYLPLRSLLNDLIDADNEAAFQSARAAYQQTIADMVPVSERFNEAVEALWNNNVTNTTIRAKDAHRRAAALERDNVILLSVVILLSAIAGFGVTRSISAPTRKVMGLLNQIGEGDLRVEVDASLTRRKDEIGELGRALNTTTRSVRQTLTVLVQGVQTLSAAATELLAIVEQNSKGSEDLRQRARSVASAAEQMNANTNSVAAGMEQTNANLSSVAAATEEMTATIGEIAANTERARTTTRDASQRVNDFSTFMKGLGDAAKEIGKVTQTINQISEQTNLLALNATIEAARAGAAGKGFAVVANEIKELAQQTAKATDEIQSKISAIQDTTGTAVEDVVRIVDIIRDVSETVVTIAAAIEEQSSVTRDVSGNIAEASRSVQESSQRTHETAAASQNVAAEIAQVNQTAMDIASATQQSADSARELSQLSEQLRDQIHRFRI